MLARAGVAVLTAMLVAAGLVPASASAASLYSGRGPRPGPDLLYAPAPPTPPQLQNTGVWRAPPILVSGASAYDGGEFLYQDFLYDDHGAREDDDPTDPRGSGYTFARPNGSYTYPTDPAYANNAADLVELRVKPLSGATAFRVTLNSMKDPSLVAFSIAIGGTPGVALPFPHGANVLAPADLFLTVHPAEAGMTAELVQAATGTPAPGGAPTVRVDVERRQIEVRVPHSAWNPGEEVVRLAAGVGLWDGERGRYLVPQRAASARQPGGAGNNLAPPAFFNVAFRNSEPMPIVTDVAGTSQSPAWWRDRTQGDALMRGDITELHADVDFGKLAARVDDDGGVPKTGPFDRILASRFETEQGVVYSERCLTRAEGCKGAYQGRLQPYAIYVPRTSPPSRGYGMTLLLHSLSAVYNQYLGSRNQSQFGERGSGSIVVTPLARGPDGSYTSYAAADVFEVWADVARRYRLDAGWTVTTGYSMGAIGSFKLAEMFPDLFARIQPTVGWSGDNDLLASLRNVPVLMWNAAQDELVNPALFLPTAQRLDSLGYRYELDVFNPADHFALAINDQYAPAAAFLGAHRVGRNPRRVTYVVNPNVDYPDLGLVADHAYWLSNVRRRADSPSKGTVDVVSHGFDRSDPPPSSTQFGGGTLTGGSIPVMPFTSQSKDWGEAPAAPRANRLDVTARNIGSVTINVRRARVTCSAEVNVDSDGPTEVLLGDCGGLPRRCVDRRKFRFRLHRSRGARVVRVEVFINGKRRQLRRGRDIRRIRIRRLPRRRFVVRIVATHSNGLKLISTRTYRGCRKSRPRGRRTR